MSHEHAVYLSKIKRKERFVVSMRYVILIGFLLLWELFARIGVIDPFIASSPSRVVRTILSLYNEGSLFTHIGTTLYETVVGFLLGTLMGILLASILWWFPTANKIFDPYLVVLNALPKIALGPILIVWIGATEASIIAMGVLISLIVTIMTVLNGFNEISDSKQKLMLTLGASKWQIFVKIVLPASIPTMMSALKLSVGMTWVGIIVGEYLVSKAGLGYLIVYGGQVFQLDLVMASIILLCILAALMYYIVAYFEKRIIKWRKH
ncbi:ABC transporter permease [Eubacteriales bacterium OttesenSCG-928-K08]|nr:ABC transporter permease [Eubacteriales bacterium OttesenSCG-928-K08]